MLPLLAVSVEVVPSAVPLGEDEPPLAWVVPLLEAIMVEVVPPVTPLDEDESAPEVLMVFEAVAGAG